MILPDQIVVSGTKKIPLFGIAGRTYGPHRLLRIIMTMRGWRVLSYSEPVILEGPHVLFTGTRYHATLLFDEWNAWQRLYLPNFSLKDKTVLDLGAGCGETAYFFLRYGAKQIFSVEPDPIAFRFLRKNIETNHWNVVPIREPFRIEQFELARFDFIKMDIEGSESQLLHAERLPAPMVIEAHTSAIAASLIAKFNLRVAWRLGHQDVYGLQSWMA